MTTSQKLAMGVALVLAAVAGTWKLGLWGADDKPSTTPVVKPTEKSNIPRARPVPVGQARVAPISVRQQDDPTGGQRLEGQVIDEDEAPVAGAVVSLSSVPPRHVVSGEDGSFVFTELLPRTYGLEAHKDSHYAGPVRLEVNADAEPAILRLQQGRAMSVTVLRADDRRPVPGAQVEVRSLEAMSWSAVSNEAGIASFSGTRGAGASLHVRADGYAGVAVRLTEDAPIVMLHAGVEMTGVVVDQDDNPVANAHVLAARASEPFALLDRRDAVPTDSKGAFRFSSLSSGNYRFSVIHENYANVEQAPITIGSGAVSSVKLRVVRGASLVGMVADSNGAAVTGATVSFVAKGSVPWRTRRRALTDSEGRYHMGALPWGEGNLVASHRTGASEPVAVAMQKGGEHEANLELTITGSISGTVTNVGGDIIPEAQVHVEPVWTGGAGQRAAWEVRDSSFHLADGGGAFRIAGLPTGSYELRATRPGGAEDGYLLNAAVTATSGEEGVALVLSDAVVITGRLQNSEGEAPELFTVRVGSTAPRAFAGAEGAFLISVPAGTHALQFAGPSFVPRTLTAEVEPGAAHDVGNVVVEEGRVLSGRVVDAEGASVAECEVAAGALLTGDGSKLYIEDESIMAQSTTTDAEGRFVLPGLGQHPITVVAGHATGRSRYLRLPAGMTSTDLTLVLEPTSALQGKATLDGKPIAETVVIATPIGTNASNFVVTGSDGTFAYDALPAGEYIVFPMVGGGGPKPKDMFLVTAMVAETGTSTVDIRAVSGAATLEVEAQDAEGNPMLAQVMLIQDDAAIIEDGTYPGDVFLDGSWLRGRGSETALSIHIRAAMGGPARIENLRPGRYAACIAPPPKGPPPSMRCLPVTVEDGHAGQTVTVQYRPATP